MTQVNDNSFFIDYILQGSQYSYTMNYLYDIHNLQGYYSKNNVPFIVRKMIIGKNLSCYGMIVSTINNQTVMNYQHFGGGIYEFKTPIVFITIHLNKVV